MKKKIMMMLPVAALAFGARAGTIEWGLDYGLGVEINFSLTESDPEEWPWIATRAYVFVFAGEDTLDLLANAMRIETQLGNETFDGTDPSLVDCKVFTPENLYPEFTGPPPTHFTTFPGVENMEIGVVILLELLYPGHYSQDPTEYGFRFYLSMEDSPWSALMPEGVIIRGANGDGDWAFTNLGDLGYPVYVPEPASGLLALAGIGLLIARKRGRK